MRKINLQFRLLLLLFAILLAGTTNAQCNYSSTNGTLGLNSGTGIAQPITATCNSSLVSVSVYHGTGAHVYPSLIEVRSGSGVTGAVLYSQSNPEVVDFGAYSTHTLTSNVLLTNGQVYTIVFYNDVPGNRWMFNGSQYSAGMYFRDAAFNWGSWGAPMNFTFTTEVTPPTVPTLSASSTSNCGSMPTTLSISSGSLNSAPAWKWYSGSCGGIPVGTGTSINVSPSATTTYYARGEGGAVTPGNCGSIQINVTQLWYLDADGDGYYVGNPVCQDNNPGAGYTTATMSGGNDCDDNDPTVHDGNTPWYLDVDGDHYYTGNPVISCHSPGANYIATGILGGNDCDDNDATVHDGNTPWYLDVDGDHYYTGNPVLACHSPGANYVATGILGGNDCDDNDATVHATSTWYLDVDNDHYYTGNAIVACHSPGIGYTTTGIIGSNDCDDNDATVHATSTWYLDADNDHYYTGSSVVACHTPGIGYTTTGIIGSNDCDDNDATVHATSTWYLDADNDHYYTGNAIVACHSPGIGYTTTGIIGSSDCDDNDPTVYPAQLDLSFMGAANNAVTVAARQADGKMVISGNFTAYNGVTVGRIARLNVDGTLDNTFNSTVGVNSSVSGIAIQTDGKIIIAGSFTSYNGSSVGRIARLNADGTIDNTFATGAGINGNVLAIALQADGKLLVAGNFTSYNSIAVPRILRINTNGSIDGSFTPGSGPNTFTSTGAIAVQADGKIIIGSSFTSYNSTTRGRIARLNSNGTIDLTFNSAIGLNSGPNTLAIQVDGKIIAGGTFSSYNSSAATRIVRINTDGTIDNSFTTGSGFNSTINKIILQADNRVIVGGAFTTFNGNNASRVARLNTDGSMDNGLLPTPNGTVNSMLIQPDNKIILGGAFTSYAGVSVNYIVRINGECIVSCIAPTVPTINASAGSICNAQSSNLSIANGTLNSATAWKWYSGSCGGTLVGTGTSITVTPTTTTTYYVRGEGGCVTTGSCASITITVKQPTASTTSQSICADALPYTWNGLTFTTAGSQTAHLNNVAGCDSAATLNLAIKQTSSSTTNISICSNELPYVWNGLTFATAGSQTAHLTNAVGCDSAATLNLTLKQTSSSTTNISICANALPYTWNGLTFVTGGSQTVHFTNAIGCDSAAILNLTVNPLPSTATASVIQPTCTTATGTINITAPLGADYLYSIGGAYQSNSSFATLNPGTYTLSVQNTAGCFAAQTTAFTVDPQPILPAAPTVTGIVNVCAYTGTATQITYTASAVAAISYTWSVPPSNVAIISGQGTANLTVTFGSGYPAQNNKQFRVSANSACGTGPLTIFGTFTQQPNTASPITGPTSVCELIGTAATATYTISAVTAATEYNWSPPAGTIITHPNGTGVNDTIVRLTFLPNFTGGNISVVPSNNCGNGGTRSLQIGYAPASTPGLISGSTSVCANMVPNGVAATYSVVPVQGAASYNWTAPAGAIVTHPNGAGINDYAISVLYPNNFTSGAITVSTTNGCGTSSIRSLSVTRLNPATPGVPDVIQTGFCGEPTGRVFTYTLATMPSNATAVLWTVPTSAGAILLSGQGTSSIAVSYPPTSVDGFITVQAVSNCGSSVVRSVAVKMPACAEAGSRTIYETRTTAVGSVRGTQVEAAAIKVFPNPTINIFTIQVKSANEKLIHVRIIDLQGRELKQLNIMPNQTINIGSDLKTGTYLLQVTQGNDVQTTKLVKF